MEDEEKLVMWNQLNLKKLRQARRAIKKALAGGWNPDHWPLDDAMFEIDCCFSVLDLLRDKSFEKALGAKEFYKFVDKMLK